MCCLGRRRLGRRRARSTRAALASTLAVATVWREAARVLPRAAAAWPSLGSLLPVAMFVVLMPQAISLPERAALASTPADATVWREAARVLPRSAAAWPSPCSLYVGCAGFYTLVDATVWREAAMIIMTCHPPLIPST